MFCDKVMQTNLIKILHIKISLNFLQYISIYIHGFFQVIPRFIIAMTEKEHYPQFSFNC